MAKTNSVREAQAPFAGTERVAATETKGTINLRIEARTRQLIDDAAAVLGKTRTEFMIESARDRAIDALLDQRLFVFPPDQFDAFVEMIENPPEPGPKLRKLMQRKLPWSE